MDTYLHNTCIDHLPERWKTHRSARHSANHSTPFTRRIDR